MKSLIRICLDIDEGSDRVELQILACGKRTVPTGPLTLIKDRHGDSFPYWSRFEGHEMTFMEDLAMQESKSKIDPERILLRLLMVMAPALWSCAQDDPEFQEKLYRGLVVVSFLKLEDILIVNSGQLPLIRFIDPSLLHEAKNKFAKWHNRLDHAQGFTVKIGLIMENLMFHKVVDIPFSYRHMFDPTMQFFKTASFAKPVDEDEVCQVCGKPATKKCSCCLWNIYCSKECLYEDRANHLVDCKKYKFLLTIGPGASLTSEHDTARNLTKRLQGLSDDSRREIYQQIYR